MNWKLIFSLSSFGVGMGLCSLMGLGPFLIFFWPIVIVTSVCLIGARAPGKFALHGFMVGAMMQLWAGAINAYYIFDLSRIGLVEVTPYHLHPQLINAFETAAAAAITGAVIATLLLLTTKLEQRRISQAR
jgi:hypothetical protein